MIKTDLKYEVNDKVREDNTALYLKSGTLKVYSTIAMLNRMEEASYKCIENYIDEGKTSVGVLMNVEHISASPVGADIRVVSEVSSVSDDGRSIEFSVSAYDNSGLIGCGTHKRVIVTEERFIDKCYKKLEGK